MDIKDTHPMTAWERMQAGLVYNDFDSDLFQRRVAAKKIFNAYNRTTDEDTAERKQLLEKLFRHTGERVHIEPDFKCEFGKNITIGNDVYINFGCIILDCADVTIGNNVLIGPNFGIYAVNHGLDPDERIAGACMGKPVHICDKVWIGGDVKIMAGVTIGKGSVIGAGSVVTKDIPPHVIAAGNPCRVIRKITDADKTGFTAE